MRVWLSVKAMTCLSYPHIELLCRRGGVTLLLGRKLHGGSYHLILVIQICNPTSLPHKCYLLITQLLTTTMSASDSSSQPPSTRLSYTIAGCSEHSNRYVAENVMVDAPTDPNSRWSGQHESPSIKQWILLRLDTLSVIGEFFDSPYAELLLRFC